MAMFGSTGMLSGDYQQPLQVERRPVQTPEMPDMQGGFLSPGSKWANVAGILGDVLKSNTGGEMMFTQNMLRQRRRLEDDDRDWQKWVAQEQWKRANPQPVNNDTVADYDFITGKLGAEAAQEYLRNKTLPPPFVQKNPDGTSTIYPQGMPRAAAPSGPQPGSVVGGFKFKGGNPNDRSSWEPVGGSGSGQSNFP